MNDKNYMYMYLYIGGKDGFVEKHLVDKVYFVKNKCYFHLVNDPDDVEYYVVLRKVNIVEVSLVCNLRVEFMIKKQNEFQERRC